ncbi:MAG: lytic transglycosylase domain-containing protein [Spirochaetes bacterium]|nr:lytic transglycosylase domain-containing protein [Spirochaetota bacterium]
MRIYKIITLNIAVIFISCSAVATVGDNVAGVGFYAPAEEIIDKLDNVNAGFKEHFLLGSSYKKRGDLKKAILHFANSCFKYSKNLTVKIYPYTIYKYINGFHIKSDYYNDAVYEISSLFFEYREFEYVVKFVNLMSRSATALYRDAAIIKANAMMELGRPDEAIFFLKELASRYNDISSKSLIQIRIASAYERKNDFANAVKEYFNLLKLSIKTWHSGIACDRIIAIASNNKYEVDNSDDLLFAASLYYNAKYKNSIDILIDLLGREPEGRARNEALNYAVRNYVRTDKLNEAEKLIMSAASDIALYNKLLKIEADELWVVNKRQFAFNIYQKLYLDESEEISKGSYRRIIQYLISKNAGYEKLLAGYVNKYPKDKACEYFLWELAKGKLNEKNNNDALKILEQSLSLFPHGAHSGRTRFWLVKLYSGYGEERTADVLRVIKEMAAYNPDSSYTWKILYKLKEGYQAEELNIMFRQAVELKNFNDAMFFHTILFMLEKDFAKRDKRILSMNFFETIKRYRDFNDEYKKPALDSGYKDNLKGIEKYFIIGYAEGMNRELGLIPDRREFQIEMHMMLAGLGARYNNYYFGASSILKLLKYYNLKENISVLSADITSNLFPSAFSDLVEKDAEKQNIPKEMIFAVMKAESTFNHKAVSSAGAVGLMQLMPPTAKDIAKGMNMKEFDLKDPSVSIAFGIKYITWLNKFFKGDFAAVMAGYNAGAGNVKKWMNEFNSTDEDYFIEFIPFEETRSYVLRTGKFYIQYMILCSSTNFN